MADVLALGLTHYPAFLHPDEQMARALRWTLTDPGIPDDAKNPKSWPAPMKEEYGQDEGHAAAAIHRDRCVTNFRRIRAELDAFAPDVVVIWGDDQYENFQEDFVPPFCLFALEDTALQPHSAYDRPNVWGEPGNFEFAMRGAKEAGVALTTALLEQGVDVSYAYRLRNPKVLPHAFMNTLLFLDYDRVGFPYPVLPFQINCYGRHVIARHGKPSRFGDSFGQLDPPGPTPARCLQVGAAFARAAAASPLRIAVVGSSSWSHAFLHDKAWRIYPDVESDRAYYESLVDADYDRWLTATPDMLEASGQQEMLNWFCLIGAVRELGAKLNWSDFVQSYVFNSSKCFASFGVGAA